MNIEIAKWIIIWLIGCLSSYRSSIIFIISRFWWSKIKLSWFLSWLFFLSSLFLSISSFKLPSNGSLLYFFKRSYWQQFFSYMKTIVFNTNLILNLPILSDLLLWLLNHSYKSCEILSWGRYEKTFLLRINSHLGE